MSNQAGSLLRLRIVDAFGAEPFSPYIGPGSSDRQQRST
jgi:hypothetical protein